jgi:hypothetical protein
MTKFRILLVLILVFALVPTATALAKAPLEGETDHAFMPMPGAEGGDYEGFLRAWVGTVDFTVGEDIHTFDIVWWLKLPLGEAGKTTHYWMITEIWEGYDPALGEDQTGNLMLATWEHGTTTSKNSTWRANGMVTLAGGFFEGWQGRQVHESGSFWFDEGIGTLAGESIFRLN